MIFGAYEGKDMAGVNKVILIGNLGRDPELRYTKDGQAVVNFTLATNESWTDKDSGKKIDKTEWHRITAWGKLAEACGQYLTKGKRAYVEGRLQTREWEDKEGNKRSTTEINAQSVQFLDYQDDQKQSQGTRSQSQPEGRGHREARAQGELINAGGARPMKESEPAYDGPGQHLDDSEIPF